MPFWGTWSVANKIDESKEPVICTACASHFLKIHQPAPAPNRWDEVSYDYSGFNTVFDCEECLGLNGILKAIAPHAYTGGVVRVRSWPNLDNHPIFGFDIYPRSGAEFHHIVLPIPTSPSAVVRCEKFLGRHFSPAYLSTNLIFKWLRKCDEEHENKCRKPATLPPSHRILLIDVEKGCVVDSVEGAKYAALSYVWGDVKTFQMRRGNIEELRQPGSLSQKQLPKTIRDAILLTRSLRIRYLWVDSVCIVQDDDDLRNIHLNSMAAIYANSYVTFIAAEGEDANHGIPGVENGDNPRTLKRNTFRTANGDRYLLKEKHEAWPVSSKWDSRGWTYQEGLLSTRTIILNGLASWCCPSNYWQEDTEITTVPLKIGDDNKPRFPDDATIHPLTTWASLLKQYNKRSLTRDADVLPAFAGVAAVLKTHFKGGFFFGIPEEHMYVGLLWRCAKPVRRRVAVVQESGENSLPSWSWVGWEGPLDLALWSHTDVDRLLPENAKAITTPTQIPDSSNIIFRKFGCCGTPDHCPHIHLQTTMHVLQPRSFHVPLRVMETVDGFRISTNAQTIAFIYPPEDVRSKSALSRGKDCSIELIALSTGLYKSSYLGKYFVQYAETKETMIVMYNILWIERDKDIAQRKALGLFHREWWESLAKENVTIKLG